MNVVIAIVNYFLIRNNYYVHSYSEAMLLVSVLACKDQTESNLASTYVWDDACASRI